MKKKIKRKMMKIKTKKEEGGDYEEQDHEEGDD